MNADALWCVHITDYPDIKQYHKVCPIRYGSIAALGTILSRARMGNDKETSHNRGMS